MPLYDMRCDACDTFDEVFCRIDERETQYCPDCGDRLSVVIAPIMTIGPMPSKPLTLGKQGIEFHSNAELRAYQSENPDTVFVPTKDTAWRRHKDKARERSETAARKAGYRDLDDRRHKEKVEKKKRQSLGAT